MELHQQAECSSLVERPQGGIKPASSAVELERERIFDAVEGARILVVASTAAVVWFYPWEPFPIVGLIGV